jgi:isocitrate dehydrogenase
MRRTACAVFVFHPFDPRTDTMQNTFKIAVIAGDGIGKEVMPEGLRTLEAAASRFAF